MRYFGMMSLVCTVFLTACSGEESSNPKKQSAESTAAETVLEASTEVSIGISPTSITLALGEEHQFVAGVHGDDDRTVTWSTTGGTVDDQGHYQAPQQPGTYEVVATSNADPSRSAKAIVTVVEVSIGISPQAATVVTGETITFEATFEGMPPGGVDWSVKEGPHGGEISSSGEYHAPELPGIFHVVAESVDDSTLQAEAEVTVIPDFSVTLDVSTTDLLFGESLEFSGSVSEGPFDELRYYIEESDGGTIEGNVYTAPHVGGTYHLVAESVVDPNRRATVAIYVCGEFDGVLTFSEVGADATIGTDLDEVLWRLRFSYGPGHLLTDTRYAAFEPGGESHGWWEIQADGVKIARMYEGPEDIRGSADDAIDKYYSLQHHKGGLGRGYAAHATPGADGVYGTSDDHLEFLARHVHDEAGRLTRIDYYDDPGQDGVWDTEDDVLAGYEVFEYDASGFLISITERSADDKLKQVQLIENDLDGLPVSRTIEDHRGRTRAIFEYEHDPQGRIDSRIQRAFTGNGQAHPHRDTRLEFEYSGAGFYPAKITDWATGDDNVLGTEQDEVVAYLTFSNICPW